MNIIIIIIIIFLLTNSKEQLIRQLETDLQQEKNLAENLVTAMVSYAIN